jgi:hypothetical protein
MFPFACVGRLDRPARLDMGGWLTDLIARPIGLTVVVGLPPVLRGWVVVDWCCEAMLSEITCRRLHREVFCFIHLSKAGPPPAGG